MINGEAEVQHNKSNENNKLLSTITQKDRLPEVVCFISGSLLSPPAGADRCRAGVAWGAVSRQLRHRQARVQQRRHSQR